MYSVPGASPPSQVAMRSSLTRRCVALLAALGLFAGSITAQEMKYAEREAMYQRYLEFSSLVKGGSIEPHWMADGSSFWYAEGAVPNTVIWRLDPRMNTKAPLFDVARLRRALAVSLGHEPPGEGLPFHEFVFLNEEKSIRFTTGNNQFVLELDSYTIAPVSTLSPEDESRGTPQILKGVAGIAGGVEVRSPDGRWIATIQDHNVWLRSTLDGRAVQLTRDGIDGYQWGPLWNSEWAWWSPDSAKLAVKKVDYREMPRIPIVNWLQAAEAVEWVYYNKTGEPVPQTELHVLDVQAKRTVRLESGGAISPVSRSSTNLSWATLNVVGWRRDVPELLFFRYGTEFKKGTEFALNLLAANPDTGASRVLITWAQKTFIPPRQPTFLEDGKRFIWISDRDGWDHLYLYDLDGRLLERLTEGQFPVVSVRAIDDKAGWVYFTAHGDLQRPYDTHLYRVGLDGRGFTRLTEATGGHEIQFAPSKEFFLDTHSTVARPPEVELRRADGTLVRTVSRADIGAPVTQLKWSSPEEFVVKAADEHTDLYGVLYKPYDFDPNKKTR